jgi:hypothetical protein
MDRMSRTPQFLGVGIAQPFAPHADVAALDPHLERPRQSNPDELHSESFG